MSNIYVQEPPALGKVLLKTTVGDIDIELWTKETPRTCRNFLQLCIDGYYNGTIFHRVIPNFIVQGGDPKGDGTGGESCYGAPFKDEFHQRLRFSRRGLVAMANAGKDDNGSQFFFTLNATPELQNKHTIFGKVTGDTVYNMIKLAEGDIDSDDRPAFPHKITGCQILINPFEDIVPRNEKPKIDPVEKTKTKEKGVKNFGLLSFGVEAEEEEDQSEEFRGKPKSTHDLLNDPKLSKSTGAEPQKMGDPVEEGSGEQQEEEEEDPEITLANIRDKLSSKKSKLIQSKIKPVKESVEDKSDDEFEEYYLGKERKEARKKEAEEIRKQIRSLKKEMAQSRRRNSSDDEEKPSAKKSSKAESNEMIQDYEEEQEKYKKKLENIPKKGASRDSQRYKKPWVKKLYENTGIYPDNYTDQKFLKEMKKNINVRNVTFLQCFLGSCRVSQKMSMCVLFSVVFTYIYNEWISAKSVLVCSSLITITGYVLYFILKNRKGNEDVSENKKRHNITETKMESEEERYISTVFQENMNNYIKKTIRKKKSFKNLDRMSRRDDVDEPKKRKPSTASFLLEDLKMVLIYLVFGYLSSPILHTLTDTVSTDTIFATTIFMMMTHLIFSDYGISVAMVSNSLSINSAIFGSICLASRLSTTFCAFVLLTVSVQTFVLTPILMRNVWDKKYAVVVYGCCVLTSFVALWSVSTTLFCIFLIAILFLNVYCPHLFVKWQKYKDNIYGPWDEAVVHDSDDLSECIGVR